MTTTPGFGHGIGDHAADLPQDVLRELGGRRHPLRRKIIAPSETRIRTLLHLIDTDILDRIIGGWLRDLADAGKPDGLLTAIAVGGKWLRGVSAGRSSSSPPCCTSVQAAGLPTAVPPPHWYFWRGQEIIRTRAG